MSLRVAVLFAVLLLLFPGSAWAGGFAASCDPSSCCCERAAPAQGPALSRACCCEAQPASELPPQPPNPERLCSPGPELPQPQALPAPEMPAPAMAPLRELLVPAAEPRPPPRPLFLLHAAFLC